MIKKNILSFVLLIFAASGIQAQWQSIAPNLIGQGPYGNRGAMATANGVAWAGLHELFKSTDKGLSWQNVPFPLPSGNFIQYISFFDANSGLISTDAGLFVTHDQGATWKAFFQNEDIWAGIFSGSSNTFVVGNATIHSACFTQDGGSTWTIRVLGYSPKDFYSSEPGNVIAFVETTTSSFVARTNDFGNTWVNQGGTMEPDAHSFGVIPCDGKIIFGINEEGGNYSQDNNLSEVYLSRDGGASFKSLFNYPTATLSGCIAITPGVIYIPARSTGILESTDSGATWVTVSGPVLPIDCHDIVTIDDTILLAADKDGTIWRNIDPRNAPKNSATKGILSVSPLSVQFPDSVSPCAQPVSKTVFIARDCSAPSINRIGYSGNKDSNYFTVTGKPSGDSLKVTFFPDSGRSYSTNLQMSLNDGSIITIPLQGFGKPPQILSVGTADIRNDTIGATIYIPITSQPLIQFGNLDLSVHFDTSMLIYQGTFAPGSSTDRTIATSVGFARLHFPESTIQSLSNILGYAEFRIFPTHTPCTTVLFDSMSIINDVGVICGLAEPSFSSQICSEIVCGTAIISDFMRYNKF
ncbi:MAG: WD40/YVTN/BNR-like repeat-containing protein, partial [Candidatus Kapaibacterium sp.]